MVGWVWLAGPGVVGDSVVGLPCVVAVQEGAGGRKNGRLCVLKAWPIILVGIWSTGLLVVVLSPPSFRH